MGPWTTEVGALCRGYVARRHVTYVKGSGPPAGITMCRCPRFNLEANPRNEALGLSRPFGCQTALRHARSQRTSPEDLLIMQLIVSDM